MNSFKKYVAEFIGTMVLVTLGCGTAMLVGCDAVNGSGYLLTALAFGLTTYASLITRSFLVGAVCTVLSLMIFVLKVTNTKARKINMVFSAALGILIVLFVYQLVLFGPEIFKLFNF